MAKSETQIPARVGGRSSGAGHLLSTPSAPVRLASARGRDGRLLKPGDRVGYQVRDGHWLPATILHLERAPDGEPVAWLLNTAPEMQGIEIAAARRCVRLERRGRAWAPSG